MCSSRKCLMPYGFLCALRVLCVEICAFAGCANVYRRPDDILEIVSRGTAVLVLA